MLPLLWLSAGCQMTGMSPTSKTVARVNDESITVAELIAALPEEARASENPIRTDPEQQMALREALLDQLIERKMLLQEALRLQVRISDKNLKTEISLLMGDSNPQDFVEMLQEQGRSRSEWEQATEENLIIRQLLRQLAGIKSKQKPALTEVQVRAYYEEHREEWQVEKQIKLRQIVLDTPEKAEELRQMIEGGADFDEIARLHSKHPIIEKGPGQGYLTRDEVPLEFDPLFESPINALSPVIQTPFGYHIVKLEDKKDKRTLPFAEIKDRLTRSMLTRRKETVYDEWIAKIRQRTEVHINEELLRSFT